MNRLMFTNNFSGCSLESRPREQGQLGIYCQEFRQEIMVVDTRQVVAEIARGNRIPDSFNALALFADGLDMEQGKIQG